MRENKKHKIRAFVTNLISFLSGATSTTITTTTTATTPTTTTTLQAKGKYIQLNLHETDLLFGYLSHHLTWHCSSISEDLHSQRENTLRDSLQKFNILHEARSLYL